MKPREDRQRTYDALLEHVFFSHYEEGAVALAFRRSEIIEAADHLGISQPKNIGDVVYSSRYRSAMPRSIQQTAEDQHEWIVAPAGRSVYEFRQVRFSVIEPNPKLLRIKVPDATPGVINMYSLGDEQALLARLRYYRLIDIFTRSTWYSLQNHLRTSIPVWNPIGQRWDRTQVETDEAYVGIASNGLHYCIPVEAKGANDSHNVIQMWQNSRVAKSKFPNLPVRCIAAQAMRDGGIALMEVKADEFDQLSLVQEMHYNLVPPADVSDEDMSTYERVTLHD